MPESTPLARVIPAGRLPVIEYVGLPVASRSNLAGVPTVKLALFWLMNNGLAFDGVNCTEVKGV